MIRFGPAGIPLSCKGRTLKDGIEDVHNLSLTAIEIQMVRANAYTRYPDEDEIGIGTKDVKGSFIVEIIRGGESIIDSDEPIEEDDELIYMPSGITDRFGELYEAGDMAERLDVSISLHTPHYMDLGSNNELTSSCMENIRHAGLIVNALKGDIVVTSLGLYTGRLPEEEIDANILENVDLLTSWWRDNGLKPKLGIEITGNQSVYGSLDQVLGLCDSVEGIVPVVNFPHYHSRTDGALMESDDFLDLLNVVEPYCGGSMHTSFAGVEYEDGNEKRLTPIKKGDLKFEPLAEALCDMKPEITIISGSPLLEHDAMYMRVINERVLSKRVAKAIKERKKSELAAAATAEE
ncbi:MAG: TIM barrel protein [Candidatus Methanoplasma sp.]|jgi:deoxyribonuclease-4|nr:TIM barrel protein [Candidatus Methanoplasma sp.]